MMQLPTLSGETAVFGLGRSGLACVEALLAAGNQVVAWDDNEAPRQQAENMGATLRDLTADFGSPMRLIISPGVPLTHPSPHAVVLAARASGCAILGDMDLFAMALEATGTRENAVLIGITGTNGKSTTTALIGHMLTTAGMHTHIGGNIGTPVLDLPLPQTGQETPSVYVLELSSYQLDLNRILACDIGVVLNITPDHLDRHGDMTGYVAAKELLFANGHCAKARIIGTDTPESKAMAERQAARDIKLTRIAGNHTDADIYYADGYLWQGAAKLLSMGDCPALPGAHNGQNAAAAFAVGRRMGLSLHAITNSFTSFGGMAHRLQAVGQHGGLTFVNDSKATNAEATRHALAAYDNIYWIAGGVAKAGGLSGLSSLYSHVRAAFLIGEAAAEFAETLSPHMTAHRSDTLFDAVHMAADQARADNLPQATILLSPACASFDQFADFEARGAAFCAAMADWQSQQAEGCA